MSTGCREQVIELLKKYSLGSPLIDERMMDWLRLFYTYARVDLQAENATLLVAIEAKDVAAKLVVETHNEILPIMNAYMGSLGTTHEWKKTCIASDALREALALPPSTELLEARDRVRDAKLLRAVDRYLLDIGDSCSDDPLNELAKARESGEWKPELGD